METILDSEGIKNFAARYPFLLVDRIIELAPLQRIVGIKQVSINESFFQGHFPGAPVMPGVLVIESWHNAAAHRLALREIADRDQKLCFSRASRKRASAAGRSGRTLVLEVTALRFGPRIQRMRGEAKVDGQLCADAELMSVIADRKNTPQ